MAIKSATGKSPARKSATRKSAAAKPTYAGKSATKLKPTKRSMAIAAGASKKRGATATTKVTTTATAVPAHGAVTRIDTVLPQQAWLEPWTQVGAATAKLLSQDAFTAAVERNLHFCQTMVRYSPLHLTLQMVQGLMPSIERRA